MHNPRKYVMGVVAGDYALFKLIEVIDLRIKTRHFFFIGYCSLKANVISFEK